MTHLPDYRSLITDTLAQYQGQVDFLSIRFETINSTDIVLRNRRVEALGERLAIGGQVRACHRGGWGFTSFNSLETLTAQVQYAIGAAQAVGTEATQLAEVEPVQHQCGNWITGIDPQTVPLAEKKTLCEHYQDVLNSVSDKISTTTVRYGDTAHRIILATSEGTLIDQSWVDMEMRFSATATGDGVVQVGRETTGSRRDYGDLVGLDKQVRGAAERAVQALSLPKVKGGVYRVVIDPILTGLFVHEAFGHLSEADMLYENPDMLEVMSLGRRFGSPELQIFDGAGLAGHRGSYGYDDEGVPATITQLITDGVLTGRLHSRETAGKLGEKPTGNARCLSYHYPPLVRMTNTWIAPGTATIGDLLQGLGEGIYACNWLGGMTNGEMFTFTAGEAWRVRGGQLAEPVRDVTLTGNVFQTLAQIGGIGDDLVWDESGGCGKGGQNGLPVGCGGPSLLIRDVVIGGD
ncbi:peptidase U62 modulator of DNA gyrase [Gloeomargarita lithophora Alchichica-D10]|uniref:Peptidase U62 modulator of DNA gyrase n=1 Tax=Gloeomargarita lithophora Alchichica-D10 TaxID=1188229 RepID=A0A1J0ACY7_9CYAN|nr:TldD/PmbA family protein [Gloeomargarita lithophora]APB33776.1 peptidase U62 modulator of DNA gyrase [Gloeomargarita lithophora Alchichica-D10]